MPELKCPQCGAEVPATGMSSAYGVGTPEGVSLQSARQRATCDECGTNLVRNPDDTEYGLDEWRVLERPRPLRSFRLEPMSSKKRLVTIEIEGYGPVTIRALTKKQLKRIIDEAGDNMDWAKVLVIRRGVQDKRLRGMSEEEFLAEFEGRPEALVRIAEAILDRSWGGEKA